MGGGGGIKAAAKLAGIGVANSAYYRSFTPDHPVCAAARKVARPVSIFAGSDDGKGLPLSVSAVDGAAVQNPCSDFDEWEFPEVEDGPPPRVIFAGAPTLQEAKEATSDLKEAIENMFLSPGNKFGGSRATESDLVSSFNGLETKFCVNAETSAVKGSTPTNVLKAFKLLYESSDAQNVVASIACDPNVNRAVMANPELQNFIASYKSAYLAREGNDDMDESVGENGPSPHEATPDCVESSKGGRVAGFFKNMKVAVSDMMNSLSGYIEKLFGGFNLAGVNADGTAKLSGVDVAIGASFFGLAVMVIMVVFLKRP
ncbi:unnamed protein product [Cuscuta campestris]|uniref:Uncharacterized protein n=1 Tax=Cuscuta campestris TaxID=132261 RepID=A0A484MSN4_9ASTE|nr:unnamed protein product [Cuscuta campestris]